MKLLTVENAKTPKGESLGYLTGILYLAPSDESGIMNTCAMASPECRQACLFSAGRGRFESVQQARIKKTVWLKNDRTGFLEQLRKDIAALQRKANREGLKPAVRVNGTSDLPWIPSLLSTEYPNLQFYDYTKLPMAERRRTANYHLTFSYSGHNLADCLYNLRQGINVAVVFDTPKGSPLPEHWQGYPVLDGDNHDLRFLDKPYHVVGLRAKGKARKIQNSFVQISKSIA